MAALKTTQDPTSWGDVHVYLSEMGTDGAMGTVWEDLGPIDDNALSFSVTDGTQLQLKDINGKILDELNLEPELAVAFTLLKPTDATMGKFWELIEVGTGTDKRLWIRSMVQNKNMSFKFANPKAVGSRTFEAPVASIKMNPGYEAAKGYSTPCTAKILNTGKEGWFAFGTVPAAVAETAQSGSGSNPIK